MTQFSSLPRKATHLLPTEKGTRHTATASRRSLSGAIAHMKRTRHRTLPTLSHSPSDARRQEFVINFDPPWTRVLSVSLRSLRFLPSITHVPYAVDHVLTETRHARTTILMWSSQCSFTCACAFAVNNGLDVFVNSQVRPSLLALPRLWNSYVFHIFDFCGLDGGQDAYMR